MTISEEQAPRVAIVGGSGKVAKHLIRQLHARGDEVLAIFRNPDRYDELADLGAIPVVLDIEKASVSELASAFAGCDAVVFSAGAGGGDPQRTRAVDYDGAVAAINAATLAHVPRFVMVSAIGAGSPVTDDTDESMRPYYAAKHDADLAVEASTLEYTIIRPGGLTDDAATGTVTLGETVERGSIPREEVAAVIVAALYDPRTVGHAWEVVSGDTTIADAIDAAV
jgi:uncharacterized protein YbjT (DUF2867 family)